MSKFNALITIEDYCPLVNKNLGFSYNGISTDWLENNASLLLWVDNLFCDKEAIVVYYIEVDGGANYLDSEIICKLDENGIFKQKDFKKNINSENIFSRSKNDLERLFPRNNNIKAIGSLELNDFIELHSPSLKKPNRISQTREFECLEHLTRQNTYIALSNSLHASIIDDYHNFNINTKDLIIKYENRSELPMRDILEFHIPHVKLYSEKQATKALRKYIHEGQERYIRRSREKFNKRLDKILELRNEGTFKDFRDAMASLYRNSKRYSNGQTVDVFEKTFNRKFLSKIYECELAIIDEYPYLSKFDTIYSYSSKLSKLAGIFSPVVSIGNIIANSSRKVIHKRIMSTDNLSSFAEKYPEYRWYSYYKKMQYVTTKSLKEKIKQTLNLI